MSEWIAGGSKGSRRRYGTIGKQVRYGYVCYSCQTDARYTYALNEMRWKGSGGET